MREILFRGKREEFDNEVSLCSKQSIYLYK